MQQKRRTPLLRLSGATDGCNHQALSLARIPWTTRDVRTNSSYQTVAKLGPTSLVDAMMRVAVLVSRYRWENGDAVKGDTAPGGAGTQFVPRRSASSGPQDGDNARVCVRCVGDDGSSVADIGRGTNKIRPADRAARAAPIAGGYAHHAAGRLDHVDVRASAELPLLAMELAERRRLHQRRFRRKPARRVRGFTFQRSEERRVGKECRSRW